MVTLANHAVIPSAAPDRRETETDLKNAIFREVEILGLLAVNARSRSGNLLRENRFTSTANPALAVARVIVTNDEELPQTKAVGLRRDARVGRVAALAGQLAGRTGSFGGGANPAALPTADRPRIVVSRRPIDRVLA